VKIDAAVHEDMKRAKAALYKQHRGDPNFTGCGIGLRRRNGQVTDELVVIAMVVDKLPAGAVSRRLLMPATVPGDTGTYGVDVVQTGTVTAGSGPRPFQARAAGTAANYTGGLGGPLTGAYNPPLQGCSISVNDPANYPDNTEHGTFGCLVKDNTDGTVCVLSTNSVLAELNHVAVGDAIVQPATIDKGGTAFAALKRMVPLDGSTGAVNQVDAAIAQLSSQTGYSQDVAGNLMAPISATHPAVGIALSWSDQGDAFLSRMDLALQKLNCQLLPGAGAVATPEIGVNIEKVGRTSGYTSSMIDAIDVQVKVQYIVDTKDYPNALDTFEFEDLIWSQLLLIEGDQGAVACVGGNGSTYVYIPHGGACPLLASAQNYYALPSLTSDNQLTNQIQDSFLSQSQTGNLLIGVVYLNMTMFGTRLQQDTGPAYSQAAAQAAAHTYYSTYRDLIAAEMAAPNSGTTVSQSDATDAVNLVLDVTGYKYDSTTGQDTVTGPYTVPEAQNAWILTYMLGHAMVGKTMQGSIGYLNGGDVYNFVYNTLLKAPTIVLP
jgi:hypothetical protein